MLHFTLQEPSYKRRESQNQYGGIGHTRLWFVLLKVHLSYDDVVIVRGYGRRQ